MAHSGIKNEDEGTAYCAPVKAGSEILADLHKFSGNYNFVFPSIRTLSKPIGHSTMLNALRLMGYTKEEHSIIRSISLNGTR